MIGFEFEIGYKSGMLTYSRTLCLLKIACEFCCLKSMNREDWEELLSRPEFTKFPDWNHYIILEKMIDLAEVVVSEVAVSKVVISEAASLKLRR